MHQSTVTGEWVRLAWIGALLTHASATWAFHADGKPPLPNLDRRAQAERAPAPPGRAQAMARLRAQVPEATVEWDDVVRSPRFVAAGAGFLSGPDGQGRGVPAAAAAGFAWNDPDRAAKAFLREHRELFGHGPEVLAAARKKREFTTPHNGLRTVVWEQQVEELPVFDAVLTAHTTRRGELVNVASQFVPDPAGAARRGSPNAAALRNQPVTSAAQAVALAAQNTDQPAAWYGAAQPVEEAATGPERRRRFRAPFLKGDAEAKLIWLPMNADELRLCWDVLFTSAARGEMFRTLVDVQTGEVLVRRCLTENISDATYNVYTSDSPSPFSPGHPTPLTTQPPLVARTLVTTNALNTNASPNGWINDGDNETRGNNVDAHLDRNDDDLPDLPRPQGAPARVFNFPLDLTQPPSTYGSAAVVQLFYVNNWVHDKLYELGFTEAAGNFQVNNFGRGGLGNDPVLADAQDGLDIGNANNANMATPPDGSSPRMQMFVFNGPNPDRDGDFDVEIIIHEYIHGLSNRRVGGGIGISALQSRGMGEGWSDFYALALLSEPGDDVDGNYAAGGYATFQLGGLTQNYYFGIRRYPYSTDLMKNPLTFKDIDPSQASTHPGIPKSPIIGGAADQVHNQGEVWCVALWEARANLIRRLGHAAGNQLMLQLVTDGMNLSPANPNFIQARNAILQADTVNNGGVNLADLWRGFARRGLGAGATSPSSSTTFGVVESFDLPEGILLQVAVPSGATEGAGVLVGQGQAILYAPTTSNVTVNLTSSDTTEATVPPSVVIPAGQTNAAFDITILDDALLDGSQPVTINVQASGYAGANALLRVHDNETATLSVNIPANATEGDPPGSGTVTVSAAPASAVVVTLLSSDTTEATVPSTVTIPAGQTSAMLPVTIVDDAAIDGPQMANVTAHVENWTDGTDTITVADNETTTLTVQLPPSASEAAGVLAGAGRVSISGTLTTNLTVGLMSSDLTELSVPAAATINAGQTSALFNLTMVDDALVDGMQPVTVTASASAFTAGMATMSVLDDESPPVPHSPRPAHLATAVPANTNLSWRSGAEANLIVNGDFETGTLAGWSQTPNGGTGFFTINDGLLDSPSPDGPLPPFAGQYSALARQTGPGIHTMYQDVAIPPGAVSPTLRWAHRVRSFCGGGFGPTHQYRVDIRDTANVVLATAFSTQPGDPNLQDWAQRSFDLTAFAGSTVRVTFHVNPGCFHLDVHVDDVELEAGTSGAPITNDVYFGTNPAPGPAEFLGSTTNTTWDLPMLAPLTTYYWQIVARRVGTTPGPVWQYTTRGVDHFEWSVIPTPQRVDGPFGVTVTAKDEFNTTVSNFTGTVEIRGKQGGSGPGVVCVLSYTRFADLSPDGEYRQTLAVISNHFPSYVESTTTTIDPAVLETELTGKHVFLVVEQEISLTGMDGVGMALGSVVSDFVNDGGIVIVCSFQGDEHRLLFHGGLLDATPIDQPALSSVTRTNDTPLNEGVPVPFVAEYLHTYSAPDATVSLQTDPAGEAVVLSRAVGLGHAVLIGTDYFTTNTGMDRIVANAVRLAQGGSSRPLAISPASSGNFVNGEWTGSVTVHEPATNACLVARDAENHSGLSNPFDVLVDNDIGLLVQDAPDPTVIGARLTNVITVGNSGPLPATGVTVTNTLPAGVAFVSAATSQGSCLHAAGVVTCTLGTLAGGASATVTVVGIPTLGGMVTNRVAIGRAEADGYTGNNTGFSVTTVRVPALTIGDTTVQEGTAGATNAVFLLSLQPAPVLPVTVAFTTSNGTALAGSDYAATNGVIEFLPNETNKEIAVAVLGDVLPEATEAFLVHLGPVTNGALADATATGTILNTFVPLPPGQPCCPNPTNLATVVSVHTLLTWGISNSGAGTLFGIRDFFDGLYVIDPVTATATLRGPSGVTSATCGLTETGSEVLFGSTWTQLAEIQADGSGVSVRGSQGMEGMAYDPASGTLYGALNGDFFTIDPGTGDRLATLPAWPDDCEGLAFVPGIGVQGSVFATDGDGDLHRYDVASGTFSVVGDTGLGSGSYESGLAFAPDFGLLFHITKLTGDLYSIDPSTALATYIGNTGITGSSGFSGLAYGPDPGASIRHAPARSVVASNPPRLTSNGDSERGRGPSVGAGSAAIPGNCVDLGHPVLPPFSSNNIDNPDRSVAVEMNENASVQSLGVMVNIGTPTVLEVVIRQVIGATRGSILATGSVPVTPGPLQFLDVPVTFEFLAGQRYDIAFNVAGGWGNPSPHALAFYDFDNPTLATAQGYDAGGFRVLDGGYGGDYVNTVMPQVRACIGGGLTTFAVYLGTSPGTLALAASGLTQRVFDPGPLAFSTTYYWQVVASNAAGSSTGQVWQFTTSQDEVRFTAGAVFAPENGPAAMVTLERENPAGGALAVSFASTDGTAIAGLDYTATAGTVTLPAGVLSTNIQISLIDDAVGEGDETLLMQITALPANVVRGIPSNSVITIVDDDAIRISVFADPAFVDTGDSPFGELTNVVAALLAKGAAVRKFTGIAPGDFAAAVADAQVLYIPELELDDLASALTPASVQVIFDFVTGGGTLILHGEFSDRDEALFNLVFGHSVTPADPGIAPSVLTAEAAGTAFEGGPATIPHNNGTYEWDRSSLPPGARTIYADSGGLNTTVAVVAQGAGRTIFLGYDWFDAVPLGSQDGGWDEVLRRALLEAGSGGVLPVHHFVWSAIGPTQAAGVPFPVTVTAVDFRGDTVSNFAGPVLLNGYSGGNIYFEARFDSGSDGFVLEADPDASSNLWHRTDHRFSSPTHCFYYGLEGDFDFDTGSRNAGSLRSPAISLAGVTAPVSVSFDYLLETESLTNYDHATVELSADGGANWTTLTTRTNGHIQLVNSNRFVTWTGDLSAYVGGSVILRFNFDTIDGAANEFEGWYVDNVIVSSPPPPIVITPTVTTTFNSGVWSGLITVMDPATNVFLCADDGAGHTGCSNPFEVVPSGPVVIHVGVTNSTPIPILGASGMPYPSTILVSNIGPWATRVTATLSRLAHTWPEDLDILLVAPNGAKAMLMSDAVGDATYGFSDRTLVFDDSAAQPLPELGTLLSGTYLPTDFEPGDVLPPPAPMGPFATQMSGLVAPGVNGLWSLYVADDFAESDDGMLAGGWSLEFEVSLPVLEVSLEAGDVVVSWPVEFSGVIETTSKLDSAVVWRALSPQPPIVQVGNRKTARMPVVPGSRFFRLRP